MLKYYLDRRHLFKMTIIFLKLRQNIDKIGSFSEKFLWGTEASKCSKWKITCILTVVVKDTILCPFFTKPTKNYKKPVLCKKCLEIQINLK